MDLLRPTARGSVSPCSGDRLSLTLHRDLIATSPALSASRDLCSENGVLFAREEYACFNTYDMNKICMCLSCKKCLAGAGSTKFAPTTAWALARAWLNHDKRLKMNLAQKSVNLDKKGAKLDKSTWHNTDTNALANTTNTDTHTEKHRHKQKHAEARKRADTEKQMDRNAVIQRQRGTETGDRGNCNKSVLVAWPVTRRRHDGTRLTNDGATTSGLKNGATRPVIGHTTGQDCRRRSTVPNETGRAKELCDGNDKPTTGTCDDTTGRVTRRTSDRRHHGATRCAWGPSTGRRDVRRRTTGRLTGQGATGHGAKTTGPRRDTRDGLHDGTGGGDNTVHDRM